MQEYTEEVVMYGKCKVTLMWPVMTEEERQANDREICRRLGRLLAQIERERGNKNAGIQEH